MPASGVSEAILFRTIEEHKERFGIIDYSVSQTTLDQVRLSSKHHSAVYYQLFKSLVTSFVFLFFDTGFY